MKLDEIKEESKKETDRRNEWSIDNDDMIVKLKDYIKDIGEELKTKEIILKKLKFSDESIEIDYLFLIFFTFSIIFLVFFQFFFFFLQTCYDICFFHILFLYLFLQMMILCISFLLSLSLNNSLLFS